MVQWDEDGLRTLRAAVYEYDGSVVDVLHGQLSDDVLQLAGDGLLAAVGRHVSGATDLAAECAVALRRRHWLGDDELADQLQAAVGQCATPLLRTVPVDLEDLASLLEGDQLDGGGRIDLETGQCWPDSVRDVLDTDEDDEDDEDDEHRWLYVHRMGSHDGYRDMELFIETLDDPELARRLEIAINGKGAFRRFKNALCDDPDELYRYYQLTSERQRGRARAWLAAEGYRPVAPQ